MNNPNTELTRELERYREILLKSKDELRALGHKINNWLMVFDSVSPKNYIEEVKKTDEQK